MKFFDVIIIGAGAAGMMCAIEAGRRGRKVMLIDHAKAPGEKIRISGGGRCNFTNVHASPANFISQNPRFCVSALKRYTPSDFIDKVKSHNIAFNEKTLGQLFCDHSSKEIIAMLTNECRDAGVTMKLSTSVDAVKKDGEQFTIVSSLGALSADSLVLATGGKSIPKMGATDFAYRIAKQFGLAIVEPRPALVPLTFAPDLLDRTKHLSGVSADSTVSWNNKSFREALLFTHRGLSGPSILQISSYWREGDEIDVNLMPDTDIASALRAAREKQGKLAPQTVLASMMPKRLADAVCENFAGPNKIGEFSNKHIDMLARAVNHWRVKPVGSEGYRTAEVTLGGIDTDALSSRTMEVKSVPGLYFIGEALDVTGWLGGYNFQWAWASAWAAGQVV